MNDNGLGAFLAFFGAFIFIFVIIAIICYVVFSLGLMTLARRKGIENDFLAFVPIAQLYILGLVIKELKVFSYDIPNPELVLPGASIAFVILRRIPVIGWFLPLASFILNYS